MSQQPQTTTLSELKKPVPPLDPSIKAGFDTVGGFDLIQRTAKLFAASNIVPQQFQGNLPNCVIAVDMALLMVCQNLYIVHGRPAWSAQFLIATLNQCGRFTSIRYEFQGEEGKDEWGCRAVATELATGEKLAGPLITIGLAKKEGWYGKNGSKWQSMPELMLRYRAASWFVRAYAPEIAMGLKTAEEVQDTYDLEPAEDGTYRVSVQEMKEEAQDKDTPSKRNAVRTPTCEMGLLTRTDGKIHCCEKFNARRVSRISMHCLDSGTRCSLRIFIFSAGIFQTRFSKSISDHSALRTSPGRQNVRADHFNAIRMTMPPAYSSIFAMSRPTSLGSVSAALGFTMRAVSAPLKSLHGSDVQYPHVTPYRKIREQTPNTRYAVFVLPSPSILLTKSSTVLGWMSLMSNVPICGYTNRRSRASSASL